MNSKRVGIIGLLQESNTFIDGKTTLQHFEDDLFLIGDAILEQMADAPHEVGGFLEGLKTVNIEVVPIFLTRSIPYGVIEAQAFDSLISTMLNELEKAGPLDGILAAPHGATVAENQPDADGYWLSEVRKAVDSDVPIVTTIDPHANLSEAMVNATNAIIAYSTNPHLDQREKGIKAAELMTRILQKEVRPVQYAAFPSMAINIQSQNTSQSPLSDLYQTAQELAQHPDVLSHSIVLGFPYADVSEMGSSVIVVTDNSTQLAKETAEQIGDIMWERRNTF
jgi:microcystin degradation protein MlrC